jgi:hypothetical protein
MVYHCTAATTGYTKTKDYSDDGTVEIIKTYYYYNSLPILRRRLWSTLYVEKNKTLATGTIVDKSITCIADYLGSIVSISDEMD